MGEKSIESTTIISIISGTIAGCGATVIKQPLERVKWLRQIARADSELNKGTNYWRVMKSIYNAEGIMGPFRGTYAGITRNVPHAALIYTVYPHIKTHLSKHSSCQFSSKLYIKYNLSNYLKLSKSI